MEHENCRVIIVSVRLSTVKKGSGCQGGNLVTFANREDVVIIFHLDFSWTGLVFLGTGYDPNLYSETSNFD